MGEWLAFCDDDDLWALQKLGGELAAAAEARRSGGRGSSLVNLAAGTCGSGLHAWACQHAWRSCWSPTASIRGNASANTALVIREARLLNGRYGSRVDYGEVHHYLAWVSLRSGRRQSGLSHLARAALRGQVRAAGRSAA